MSSQLEDIVKSCRAASSVVAGLDENTKNAALADIASSLRTNAAEIVAANALDLQAAREQGLSDAMIDRLMLDSARINAIAVAVEEIVSQPDPVGAIEGLRTRPNGIQVGKMRIPLGVIGIIYESRPNVTVDAAVLCLKAGNTVVLRGGSEAFHSNTALASVLGESLRRSGVPSAAVSLVPGQDRKLVTEMLQMDELIDLIIPRGGEGLIRFVASNSRIPVIKHYKGVCHQYIHADADLDMAVDLAINGKVDRPGVCNALETILLHQDAAVRILPALAEALAKHGVEIRGCEATCRLLPDAVTATDADYHAEFLALVVAIRIVADLPAAIAHIARYGSDHTEVIVTESYQASRDFLRLVPSSVVLVNASSRFSDGGQLGLGAEIGISTTKLHAYGPMGVESLTTQKFVVMGEGQIRTG